MVSFTGKRSWEAGEVSLNSLHYYITAISFLSSLNPLVSKRHCVIHTKGDESSNLLLTFKVMKFMETQEWGLMILDGKSYYQSKSILFLVFWLQHLPYNYLLKKFNFATISWKHIARQLISYPPLKYKILKLMEKSRFAEIVNCCWDAAFITWWFSWKIKINSWELLMVRFNNCYFFNALF